jgi:hypothetical protein
LSSKLFEPTPHPYIIPNPPLKLDMERAETYQIKPRGPKLAHNIFPRGDQDLCHFVNRTSYCTLSNETYPRGVRASLAYSNFVMVFLPPPLMSSEGLAQPP